MRAAPIRILFERRTHRTPHQLRDQLLTGANVLTVARSLLTSAAMLVAIVEHSPSLLIGGLLASWALDIADGQLARWKKHESALGAQLDILADRATAMWVVLGVVVFNDASALTICAGAAVWAQLSFFDQLLAGQFLRFGHWSPDEFHLEDEEVWRLNWAPAAKVFGNLPLGLLAVGGVFLWPALGLALLLAAVRVFSYLRIEHRVGLDGRYDPTTNEACFRLDGCAAPPWLEDGTDRLLDEHGHTIALRYREADKRLPAALLELLPPPQRVEAKNRIRLPDPERVAHPNVEPVHPAQHGPSAEPATPLRAAKAA